MPPSPAAGCSAEANLRAALILLQSLQACGLRRLVLCPGSRSAPLAVAAGVLGQQGLDLFTAVDERSAAFLAVGLGRGDGRPTAVVTTSGTAVANLLPAVVEADSGAVPLLLLTADRPARLKHCGANQTVNQEAFLAPCCRLFREGDPAGLAAMEPAALRQMASEAWNACLGAPHGPVHCNLPIEELLHVDAAALVAGVALALAAPISPATEAPGAAAALPAAEPAAAAPDPLDPLGVTADATGDFDTALIPLIYSGGVSSSLDEPTPTSGDYGLVTSALAVPGGWLAGVNPTTPFPALVPAVGTTRRRSGSLWAGSVNTLDPRSTREARDNITNHDLVTK